MLVTTRGDKGTNDPDADLDELVELRVAETAAAVGRARLRRALPPRPRRRRDRGRPRPPRRARRALRARAAARGRAVPRPDRGVLRRRVLQPPRPPGHGLGDARRGRAGGRAIRTTSPSSPPRASTCITCARCTSPGRSSRTAGSTSATTLERKIDALFCHASQLTETGEWFREFLREQRRASRPRGAGVPLRRGVPPPRLRRAVKRGRQRPAAGPRAVAGSGIVARRHSAIARRTEHRDDRRRRRRR